MLSFDADMRFGCFDQIIQSALRSVWQHSPLPGSHGNAEADPPALHLFSLLNSLVPSISIEHGFFVVQEISFAMLWLWASWRRSGRLWST
jgi:hypothetical protein